MPRFLGRARTIRTSQNRGPQSSNLSSDNGTQDNVNGDICETDIASTEYASNSALLMELSKDLHGLGADSLIDLPRIVVIGSQSAGKSSLVEAVSGINVPRDAGTCTRCPMEIWMSRSVNAWSCSISLEYEGTNGVSSFRPFSPTITDKTVVDLWLRRAQAAILSPHLSPDMFLNKSTDELRDSIRVDIQTLKFSRNRVRVNIEDPDAANLQFVDLPGLIQNESQELIALVRELVETYITPCNTVIVIAIPMSDDMENQQAVKLAREADPDGERTIGVLTKPDTIPSGSINVRQRWKDVLQDKEHKTKHGYYSVRLPDDEDRARNITRRESERLAAQYFSETPPWSGFSDRRRFGVPNFVTDISKLLIQFIKTNLPILKQDVNQLLSDCTSELDGLPVPVTVHHTTEMLNRITTFCEDLKGAVFATNTKNLANLNRTRYKLFKAQIHATAPDFRPYENPQNYAVPQYKDPDREDFSLQPPSGVQILGLRDVRAVIVNSTGWELPGHVPFEATKALIMGFIKLWKVPTESCFSDISDNLSDLVGSLVKSNFSRFKQLELHIMALVQGEFEEYREKALRKLQETLLREDFPYTQNDHYIVSATALWYQNYAAVIPTEYRYPQVYKAELEVMAGVRGYFQVSYKRVIDHIPHTIEKELNQAFANNLRNTLFQKLVSGPEAPTAERVKELLGEDPDIATRRESLEGIRNRLLEIKKMLERFND